MLFEESHEEHRDAERDQPVECFGPTFENDEARRAHFRAPDRRPEFRVSFQLERGEAALFNNCAVLHNRAAYEDHDEPDLKRHLMRLWLMDWDGRPTVEGVRYQGEGGIVPQGGRSRIMRSEIQLSPRSDEGRRCEVHNRHPQFGAGKTRRGTSTKRHRVTRHDPRDWSRGFSAPRRCHSALERKCRSVWIDGDTPCGHVPKG